jgi:hypothetical protein
MSRDDIRSLKRAVSKHDDGGAMLALLQRSIQFGHRRLALLRCLQAERMGLSIEAETLRYCQQVADSMSREELGNVLVRGSAARKMDWKDL